MSIFETDQWGKFQNTGLLWWINRGLHLFGWVVVIEIDTGGNITSAYPTRTPYRGFDRTDEEAGFLKVTEYLEQHAKELKEEIL